jgi:hypothetical protein
MEYLGYILLAVSIGIFIYGTISTYLRCRIFIRMRHREDRLLSKGIKPRMRSGMAFNTETGKIEGTTSICPSHYRMLASRNRSSGSSVSSDSAPFIIGD